MAFSPAAKVGVVTLASIVALGAAMSWLTSLSFGPKGYDVNVAYLDVAGLMNGASVMFMGVKVGRVVAVLPQERMVEVKAHIFSNDTHILEGSRFKIMSQGIIGEMNLEIFPPKVRRVHPGDAPVPEATASPAFLVDGERVRGDDPQRLALVMEEMTDTFNDLQKSIDPKKFQQLFAKTADNLYQTTETVKRLGAQAEGILGGFSTTPKQIETILASIDRSMTSTERLVGSANPEQVKGMVADLRKLSRGLLVTYGNIFGTEANQANDQTLRTVRNLTVQLEKLATTLNTTAGDPTVQNDVKDTIKNIRVLTGSISDAASLTKPKGIAGFAVSPRLQGVAANTPTGTGMAGNLGLRASAGDNYLFGGIEQIGEGNFVNLQFGADTPGIPLGYQFGLIRSKIGVGVDYGLSPTVTLMGQLYDPFRPTARIGATYFPLGGSHYGLLAQGARNFKDNENFIWLGVEWRPNF